VGNRKAEGHGPPLGSQNARKHGLFAKQLAGDESRIYQDSKGLQADELGREMAEFVVAKIAGAYRSDKPWTEASRLVRQTLKKMVDAEQILPEMADALAARLDAPPLDVVGKALGPLKGLLEVKRAKETDSQAGALEMLAKTIARSQERRDATGE
jgi:hypothetical protein